MIDKLHKKLEAALEKLQEARNLIYSVMVDSTSKRELGVCEDALIGIDKCKSEIDKIY